MQLRSMRWLAMAVLLAVPANAQALRRELSGDLCALGTQHLYWYNLNDDKTHRCLLDNGGVQEMCVRACTCRMERSDGGTQTTALCENTAGSDLCPEGTVACANTDLTPAPSESPSPSPSPQSSRGSTNGEAPSSAASLADEAPAPSSLAPSSGEGVNKGTSAEKKEQSDDMETWQWGLIAVSIALAVGIVLFLVNWYKNRPKKGDNLSMFRRTEPGAGAQWKDLEARPSQDSIDDSADHVAKLRDSALTSRTFDVNQSTISGLSGGNFHELPLRSQEMVDTEMVVRESGGARMFSPLSSSSQLSASFSYGTEGDIVDDSSSSLVDTSTYRTNSRVFSPLSEMESLSSTDNETYLDEREAQHGSYPRKKSIEF